MAIIPTAAESDVFEVEVTALAAGGDGVARDASGRVTFIPRTAPGDRARVAIAKATRSFAHARLVELVRPSALRVEPPCDAFARGCGGCAWQHVARAAQLDAKQAIVAGALRGLAGLAIDRIADPAPALGWRRRARFHVSGGKLGLYAAGSNDVVAISECPQLEPALAAALALIAGRTPPDGELALLLGRTGAIAVGVERPWRGAAALVGRAGIAGVVAGDFIAGEPIIEVEPGLFGGPWDFQQASAAGNAALVELARVALGRCAPGAPRALLELHAGAGNLTRAFVADGWTVTASDVARPPRAIAGATFVAGTAERVLVSFAHSGSRADAIALDPPRTGAAEAIDGIIRLAPKTVVYISCDPATLARDALKLVAAGYHAERAWPIDMMPQTAHVEVVLRLART